MQSPADKFHHPYSPYDIQLQFMRDLYGCLEKGKVGIFESPTGTGKSLSLICGSLTWLRDYKRKGILNTIDNIPSDGEPEWMLEFSTREKTRALTEKWGEFEGRLARVRAEEEKQRSLSDTGRPKKKLRRGSSEGRRLAVNESQFELEEYDSDTDARKGVSAVSSTDVDGLSASTLALLARFKGHSTAQAGLDEGTDNDEIKIFYCSRTHSQLTQFADELRRVKLPPSLPKQELMFESLGTPNEDEVTEEGIKHLPLGSRKALCINPDVSKLSNLTAINERCLDLQKPGAAADKKCRYLLSKGNEAAALDFRDQALAKVGDIEDLARVGKQLGVCPYYASRSVIRHSEIVTLPYPLLLQRSARESLNLSVKNHVVIIDEAHNLMDSIAGIYSIVVTLNQLRAALSQLTTYAQKYRTRLKGKNRAYITQVIRLISSIADHLQSVFEGQQSAEGIVQHADLLVGKGVDQINPHKLIRYLQESKLARKVDGFIEYCQEKDEQASREKATTPVLFHVQSFILSLMNPSAEGRLFYVKKDGSIQLQYMLLDPASHFRDIVEDARSVILAGGTMSPMSDYADHLFSYLPSSQLGMFSFGHVIPPENLTAHTVSNGALGSEFSFVYETRNSDKLIIDLGQTVASLCQVIPSGIIAFFPSYDYLRLVLDGWRRTPASDKGPTLFALIERSKFVFHETQDKSVTADDILQEYSNTVKSGSGALLLSVVGGRLSEGINFSDDLGRGVLIVGLPFPNIRSAVWQAKIQHIEKRKYEQSSGPDEQRKAMAKEAGRECSENACMRAVNQCIGRAIRHRRDYAAIIMIDRRYNSPRIQGKLPAWIRQSLVPGGGVRSVETIRDELSMFFRKRDHQGPPL